MEDRVERRLGLAEIVLAVRERSLSDLSLLPRARAQSAATYGICQANQSSERRSAVCTHFEFAFCMDRDTAELASLSLLAQPPNTSLRPVNVDSTDIETTRRTLQ